MAADEPARAILRDWPCVVRGQKCE